MENLLVKVIDGKEVFAAVASFVLVCMKLPQKTNHRKFRKMWKEKLQKFEKI